MNKQKQMLFALLCGLQADHPLMKSAENNANLASMLLQPVNIRKSDLFSTPESGDTFFDHPEVWVKVPELFSQCRKNGDVFEAADFLKKFGGEKTVLELAAKHKALDKLFAPEIWEGQLEEMEKLWFLASEEGRKSLDFTSLRRNIAAKSGIVMREDQLSQYGMSADIIRKLLLDGDVRKANDLLKAKGDHLKKEDVLRSDETGKTIFDIAVSWDHLDQVIAVLNENNDPLTKQDFLTSKGSGRTMIKRASDFTKLNKIFCAQNWERRLDEMMALWDYVPEDKKSSVRMDALIVSIEDKTYSDMIDLDAIDQMTMAELTTPTLPEINSLRAVEGPYEIRPLGLQKTWHNIWAVEDALSKKGEAISIEDLRLTHGWFGDTCLQSAVNYGFLEVIIDRLRTNGEWFDAKDLLDSEEGREDVLDIIIRQDKTDVLMRAENWVGHAQLLTKVWGELPDSLKLKHRLQDILSDINILSLRQAARQVKKVSTPKAP